MRSGTLRVVLILAAVFGLWEAVVVALGIPQHVLPKPSIVFRELATEPLWYLEHTASTLWTTLLGFGLALLVGVVAAIGIISSKWVENTLYTLLVSLNSIPKIALAPLFIIWLGTGIESKVAVSFLIALFSVVIDTVLGLRSADPDALDLMRTMRGSPLQMLWKVRFPHALPHMFAGMKVAISLALVGAIAGEFVASQEGLGYVIITAQSMFQTVRVFASIVLLGVAGTILFYLVDLAERLICPWHVSHRVEEARALAARG
jgi:NitT/TauT family transport system permease protein